MKATIITILGIVMGLIVPYEIGLPFILIWVFLIAIALD